MANVDGQHGEPQLLRIPYHSTATGTGRNFLVYLPIGYHTARADRWPVIFFLHGGGERGDGVCWPRSDGVGVISGSSAVVKLVAPGGSRSHGQHPA